MATIPASENEFPEVLFAEGAAPGTPAAGLVKAYAKADGLLYSKDDAGVESPMTPNAHIADTSDAHDASAISIVDAGTLYTATDVEAALAEVMTAVGAGGIPATIVAAKGDIIGASANDTPAITSVGTDGETLFAASGETAGLDWAMPRAGKAHAFASGDTASLSADTETDQPGVSITLDAGNWLIGATGCINAGTAGYALAVITTSANAHISMGRGVRATASPVSLPCPVALVSPGSSTTYKLRIQCGVATSVGLRYATGTTPASSIWAVRVS